MFLSQHLLDELWGQSPLTLAAITGQIAMIELLLKKGANIKSMYNQDQTLLGWAAQINEKAVYQTSS